MNKRGQIAIFIIIALLIVAALMLFFFVRRSPTVSVSQEFDASSFITQCIRDPVKKTIDTMLPQGGFVEPRDYKIYNDVKVIYLCKNVNYYEKCISQHPVYIGELEEEIHQNIKPDVASCLQALALDLTKRGYEINENKGEGFTVELKQNVVEIKIQKNITVTKNGEVLRFANFKTIIRDPTYNLATAAQEIARQEGQFCHFETLGYNLLYREIAIEKDIMSDSTKIYTLTDKESKKKLMIAIRGCAIPAGL